MPRVVPSQAVALIDHLFPDVPRGTASSLHRVNMEAVMTLLELVDHIPQELMPSDVNEYAALAMGLNTLRTALHQWPERDYPIGEIPSYTTTHPIRYIRDILTRCPDEAPSQTAAELLFITDLELREGLRIDISTANHALANGEWKAATVLAGSVVEALLLWAIQQARATDLHTAISTAVSNNLLRIPPQGPPECWSLLQYIAVAQALACIDDTTARQANLAKDFRNLIHPGRVQRLAQTCTRGTALAALAAIEMVVRCLTP